MKKFFLFIFFLISAHTLFALRHLNDIIEKKLENRLVLNGGSNSCFKVNLGCLQKKHLLKNNYKVVAKNALDLYHNCNNLDVDSVYNILKTVVKDETNPSFEIITESFSFSETNAIRVFPMPVLNELNISWKAKNIEYLSLLIYNVKGKLVKSFTKLKGQSYTTNANFLKTGVYLLKLKDEFSNKIIVTRKFVKNG